MIDILLKAAIAVGGYLLADKVTEEITGHHIHEHVFQWWCNIRDMVQNWLQVNASLGVQKIAYVILDYFDEFAVATKKMADKLTLGVWGVTKDDDIYEITTEELNCCEVGQMLPGLADSALVVQEV